MKTVDCRPTVGVDGHNLALARGTGVATYARAVCRDVVAAGWGLDLVYGINVTDAVPAANRETLFYGRLSETPMPPPKTLKARTKRFLMLPRARDLVPIERLGRVIAPELHDRAPASDRLFTLRSLFTISATYFRRYGRFLPIRMPNPPVVMHWTYPVPVRLEGAANIYTVHDLVPLRLPHTSLEDKVYHERLLRRCLIEGTHIATVSERSREDLIEWIGADPARVVNTYQPVDTPTDILDGDPDALDSWLGRLFDLHRHGYFLFFGAIEPKKNVRRLIEAYLQTGIETPLVIVGHDGWHADRELTLLAGGHGVALSGARAIRRIDYLPRAMLMRLVRGARAVLFPSIYEGFGLPAAEAMAMGVPVLTSNTGASPEIAGDAAITIDPYDVDEIASAIALLDGNAVLRARLGQTARESMRRFSPANHQTALAALYKGAAPDAWRWSNPGSPV